MDKINVCLLGGTGFVGYHLANHLARADYRVRVPSRRCGRHRHLMVIPTVDLSDADIHDDRKLAQLIDGCEIVINLVGILNPRHRDDFRRIHVDLPRRVVNLCAERGVRRLVHMSALNADAVNGTSAYLRSKGEGEKIALDAHSAQLAVSVFRPSVIFGAGDHLYNRFAALLRFAPVLPLACAQARFAPVYVEDVARVIVGCLGPSQPAPQRFDLCGPKTYTLLEIVEYTSRILGKRRMILPLGRKASNILAGVLGVLPGRLLTRDNVNSMQVDAVCHDKHLASTQCKTAVEAVVPLYLGRKDQRSLYDLHRSGFYRDQA